MRALGFGLALAALGLASAGAAPGDGIVRSAQSGAWSAASTWEGGAAPGAGARVQVRAGHTVTYDVAAGPALRLVHVAGTLAFARDRSTRLDVGVLKIQPGEQASERGADCEVHHPPPGAPVAAVAAAADPEPAPPLDVQDYDNRFAQYEKKPPSRALRVLGAVAIPLLVVAFLLQAIFHFRDALAAHFPATKPVLSRACTILGCSVRPLRNVDALSIEASDLQADPAHRGLLILSATIRNRATHAIGYPHLELTLTDSADQVVVRRALAPSDYLSGTANPAAGIPANGEIPVKVFIDASATTQAGYRLYLFFP